MREYQVKKKNPYWMDREIYMQMFYLVRSYPKLAKKRQNILYASPPPPDGMPRGTSVGNPTEQKAIACEVISRQLSAIDQTIVQLNAKYEHTYTGEPFDALEAYYDYGVFCYYRSKKCKDTAPTKRTWHTYRSEFLYSVAYRLGYVI